MQKNQELKTQEVRDYHCEEQAACFCGSEPGSTNLRVKDMPEAERPYEKCLLYGAEALSDAELIAAIIRTGSTGERSTDLAYRILNAGRSGLLNLYELSLEELMQIRGIGRVKAIQLKCIAELSRRIAKQKRGARIRLGSPQTIADYYMEQMRHLDKEHLLLMLFDAHNNLIGDHTLTIGTADCSLISATDVFRKALSEGAARIVLLHNHPSGDPQPSEADAAVTESVAMAGSIIGIELMDNIIIGDNCFYSFAQEGRLQPDENE